jgi:hypothetical protein
MPDAVPRPAYACAIGADGFQRAAAARPTEGRLFATRPWTRWVWFGLLALVLAGHVVVRLADAETEPTGSSCTSLTDAGRETFANAVLPLQLAIVAWIAFGGVIAISAWWRRTREIPRTLATSLLLVSFALLCVAGAAGVATEGIAKLLLAVVGLPAIAVVTALLALAARLSPDDEDRRPWGLAWRTALLLLANLTAAVVLGGNGEGSIC